MEAKRFTGEYECRQCGLGSKDLKPEALALVLREFGRMVLVRCEICEHQFLIKTPEDAMKVTSGYVERCKPYKVRMTCGHIETRLMREATAGVPWSEDVILEAPYAGCDNCDPSKRAAREGK